MVVAPSLKTFMVRLRQVSEQPGLVEDVSATAGVLKQITFKVFLEAKSFYDCMANKDLHQGRNALR